MNRGKYLIAFAKENIVETKVFFISGNKKLAYLKPGNPLCGG